jgi:hypothetical protein
MPMIVNGRELGERARRDLAQRRYLSGVVERATIQGWKDGAAL